MTYKKNIKIGTQSFLLIELTKPLSNKTKIYPGDPKPKKISFSKLSKTGYEHDIQIIGDHVFQPHADAPKHQNKDLLNKGIEVFDINYSFNNAYLIDLSKKTKHEVNNIRYELEIKKEHILPYIDKIKSANVGALIFRTGYDIILEKNISHNPNKIPYFNTEAADLISKLQLKVIGIDSLTIDPPGVHYAHQKFKNMMIVESLVHLHDINKSIFFLQTSPLRISGATGSPVIATAFILNN